MRDSRDFLWFPTNDGLCRGSAPITAISCTAVGWNHPSMFSPGDSMLQQKPTHQCRGSLNAFGYSLSDILSGIRPDLRDAVVGGASSGGGQFMLGAKVSGATRSLRLHRPSAGGRQTHAWRVRAGHRCSAPAGRLAAPLNRIQSRCVVDVRLMSGAGEHVILVLGPGH
jgi:hypothetical protein